MASLDSINVTLTAHMPNLIGLRMKIGAWFIRLGCWIGSMKIRVEVK
jgi:hypothetical protein